MWCVFMIFKSHVFAASGAPVPTVRGTAAPRGGGGGVGRGGYTRSILRLQTEENTVKRKKIKKKRRGIKKKKKEKTPDVE